MEGTLPPMGDSGGPWWEVTYEQLARGATWVVTDVRAEEQISAAERAFFAGQGVMAWVDVPVVRDGQLEAALCVVQGTARDWTEHERLLVESTAERLWSVVQRGHAEATMRESDERYRTLFNTMGQGYFLEEIVRDGDGRPVDFRYLELNPAFERLTGVSREQARGRTATEVFGEVDPVWLAAADAMVRTGESQRVDHYVEALDRCLRRTTTRAGAGGWRGFLRM